jgi:VWFA-related protein
MRFLWLLAGVLACAAQEASNFSVSVDLVPITCSITDRNGQAIPDMNMNEFLVMDNGKNQPVRYLWREADAGLTIGLIVDVSGSQAKFVREHRRTMAQFLATVLRPQDRAFVASIGPWVKLVTDTTSSAKQLSAGVAMLDPQHQPFEDDLGEVCRSSRSFTLSSGQFGYFPFCGGTLLWQGLYASAREKMRQEHGRKALLVLTDGMDNATEGHSLNDAIEAAQGADASVYVIHYWASVGDQNSRFVKFADKRAKSKAAGPLRRLSQETGGRYYDAALKTPAEIFEEIENDLRTQYVLAFVPSADRRDGKFHKVEIRSNRGGVVIRARQGYTARRD